MTVSGAVRELRRAYRETQPAFAERLGLSARAVSSYESKTRKPDARSLLRLEAAAQAAGREDLESLFSKAFSSSEIYSEMTDAVRSEVANLLALKNGDEWLRSELSGVIHAAKVNSDPKLAYMELLLDKFIALSEEATKKLAEAQKMLHREVEKKLRNKPAVASTVPGDNPRHARYIELDEDEE